MGCGAIARWHLSAIRSAAKRTVVTAAVDIDAARAEATAAETGARPFTSLDEALGELRDALAMVRSVESKRWEAVW